MAEIFDFIVNDNRTITYKLTEPIMLEDNGVSDWRFHIPNVVNGLDATGWQWWLVYVNAKNEKYTIPLTLEYDYDRPDAYSIAMYTVDYGMSCKVGSIKFSIEAIDTDAGGVILHEWHTKTYRAAVEDTLQGNQVEYSETESDIISALLIEVRNRINQLVGGATPLPVNLKSLMADYDKVYLYTGSEPNESTGYWYCWNGTDFVPGGLYGAGITDSTPTQGSSNAVSSGGVYEALRNTDTTLTQAGQAADAFETGDEITSLKEELTLISKESESDAADVDLDVSDRFGNVLVRFVDGGVQTKKFNSTEVYGVDGSSGEIDLSLYPTVNFNFEYGNTWTSGGYRGVLIPVSDLGDYVRFVATENKIVCCFLTDNAITANQLPHCCVGTAPIRMGVGADETLEVPNDCAYLYVYVSQNSQLIGQIHLYALVNATKIKPMIEDLQRQIDEMRSKTGLCYVSGTEQVVRTLKHWHTNTYNDFRAYTTGDNLVTLAHISDIHNDPVAYGRFISFLNEFNGVVDCGLATGDIVDGPGTECFAEMVAEEDALEEGTKLLKVVGNHDRISAPLTELFTWMNMGISTDSENLYYVHDFADRKIRIIVLNQYDTSSGALGKTGHYSQDQLDWFVARLQEAVTNNYHVIVAYHSCSEVGLPEKNEKGFCQNTFWGFNESVSGEHIIEDIVNAFQTGGSISKSITYPDSEVTVTVNASFSSKGIFVCYICGHLHVDYIGYSMVYPNQLVCMVQGAVINSTKRTEAQAHWQGNYDTPRIEGTPTANSINVYAIDTLSRMVKVAKIGSTLTDKFVPRSFATFGY